MTLRKAYHRTRKRSHPFKVPDPEPISPSGSERAETIAQVERASDRAHGDNTSAQDEASGPVVSITSTYGTKRKHSDSDNTDVNGPSAVKYSRADRVQSTAADHDSALPLSDQNEAVLRVLSAQDSRRELRRWLARSVPPAPPRWGRINAALHYLEQSEGLELPVMENTRKVLQMIQDSSYIVTNDPYQILPRIIALQQRYEVRREANESKQTPLRETTPTLDKGSIHHNDVHSEPVDVHPTDGNTVVDESGEDSGIVSPLPSLADAQQCYEVQYTQDEQGACQRPHIVPFPQVELHPQHIPWSQLKELDTIAYGGNTYRRGDAISICTGDGVADAARISDIRDLGDGRSQLEVCWLYTRKQAPRPTKNSRFQWPRDKTHILSNHVDVVMWDTIDSSPNEGIGGIVDSWVLDVICSRQARFRERTDEHVSWLLSNTLNYKSQEHSMTPTITEADDGTIDDLSGRTALSGADGDLFRSSSNIRFSDFSVLQHEEAHAAMLSGSDAGVSSSLPQPTDCGPKQSHGADTCSGDGEKRTTNSREMSDVVECPPMMEHP